MQSLHSEELVLIILMGNFTNRIVLFFEEIVLQCFSLQMRERERLREKERGVLKTSLEVWSNVFYSAL